MGSENVTLALIVFLLSSNLSRNIKRIQLRNMPLVYIDFKKALVSVSHKGIQSQLITVVQGITIQASV